MYKIEMCFNCQKCDFRIVVGKKWGKCYLITAESWGGGGPPAVITSIMVWARQCKCLKTFVARDGCKNGENTAFTCIFPMYGKANLLLDSLHTKLLWVMSILVTGKIVEQGLDQAHM